MFDWLNYEFMKKALIAIILVTPLFGLIGTMIVNKKMAFFSDALGHSALAGIAIGLLLGVENPIISMMAFAVIFGYGLNKLRASRGFSNDTIISVFSSTAIALGLVLLSKDGNFAKYSAYLIGNILSISTDELILLALVLIFTIAFWILEFNKLLGISTSVSLAKSKGMNVSFIENIFVILVAIIVMISIKWVGVLLINSLLILPSASSKNISNNMRQYHFFAILFSIFSGVSGLIFSYYFHTSTGPTIVLILACIFFITLFFKKRK